MKSYDGYLKRKLGDSYVNLTNGGHKSINDWLHCERHTVSGGGASSFSANSLEDGWHDFKCYVNDCATTTNHGILIQDSYVNTPFQIWIPDVGYYIYKRYLSGSIGGTWSKIYAGYADSAGSISSHTLWGNTFNGTQNLTDVLTVTPSGVDAYNIKNSSGTITSKRGYYAEGGYSYWSAEQNGYEIRIYDDGKLYFSKFKDSPTFNYDIIHSGNAGNKLYWANIFVGTQANEGTSPTFASNTKLKGTDAATAVRLDFYHGTTLGGYVGYCNNQYGKYLELWNPEISRGIYIGSGESLSTAQPYYNDGALRKIWHEGNDGSGSGLDADLLDGKHSTDFYPFFKKGSSSISSSTVANANTDFSDGITYVFGYVSNCGTTYNHGLLILDTYCNTKFLIWNPDNSLYWYKRYNSTLSNGTWSKMSAGYADSAPWSGITGKPASKTIYGLTYINANGEPLNVSTTILFSGTVGSNTGTYITESENNLFLASNLSGHKIYLESTNLTAPYFRCSTGDYTIYHSGNLPAYPTKASWNYDDCYLKLAGGTLTGNLYLTYGGTRAVQFLNSSGASAGYVAWSENSYGSYVELYNPITTRGIWIGSMNTTAPIYYNGSQNVMWHAGNSNLSTVSWSALLMYTAGTIYIGYNGSSGYGNYSEGIRIYGTSTSGSHANITVGCELGKTTGYHANLWQFGRDNNNQWFMNHGGTVIWNISTSNAWTISGNVTASNFYTSSDIRKKTNITPLLPTHKLLFKQFNWKENGLKSYGLIAQEVEQYYPELVSGEDSKTVNYSAALCLAVGQLQIENEELRNKIRELENRINEIL